MVKGESVQWTKSSRSLDTLPLKVFIIRFIYALIIYIFATMWGGAMSGQMDDSRGRSSLLGAWLPSDPSRYPLFAFVPS